MWRTSGGAGVAACVCASAVSLSLLAGAASAGRGTPLLVGLEGGGSSDFALMSERGKVLQRLKCGNQMSDRTRDGRYGLCLEGESQYRELRRVDLRTGASTKLAEVGEESSFGDYQSWSPDGETLAVTVHEDRITPAGEPFFRANVVLVDVSSGAMRSLTNNDFRSAEATDSAVPFRPTWSRDGRHVTFAVERGLNGDPDSLRRIEVASGAEETIVDGGSREFAVSPNGRRIAYVSRLNGPVRLATASGRALGTIAPRGANVGEWSPDGKRLAITSGRVGAGRAHTVHVKRRKVVDLPARFDAMPVWGPDSRRLAITTRGGGTEIVNVRGKVQRRVIARLKGYVINWGR